MIVCSGDLLHLFEKLLLNNHSNVSFCEVVDLIVLAVYVLCDHLLETCTPKLKVPSNTPGAVKSYTWESLSWSCPKDMKSPVAEFSTSLGGRGGLDMYPAGFDGKTPADMIPGLFHFTGRVSAPLTGNNCKKVLRIIIPWDIQHMHTASTVIKLTTYSKSQFCCTKVVLHKSDYVCFSITGL